MARHTLLAVLASGLLCCSQPRVEPGACESGEVIASHQQNQLTCEQLRSLLSLADTLSGTATNTSTQRSVMQAALKDFRRDPSGLLKALAQLREHELLTSGQNTSLQMAKVRSQLIFDLNPGSSGKAWPASLQESLADLNIIRAASKQTGLALTEFDVEGWILYTSLCHEVQTRQALKLSIAQRVEVYRMTAQRFEAGTESEQAVLVSMGVFWPSIRASWQAASYATQQRWIARAPLPPIGDASALGYFEELLGGPFEAHATLLHETLKPLSL